MCMSAPISNAILRTTSSFSCLFLAMQELMYYEPVNSFSEIFSRKMLHRSVIDTRSGPCQHGFMSGSKQ